MPFDDMQPDGPARIRLSRPDNVVIAAVDKRGEAEGRDHLDIRIGAQVLAAAGWTPGARVNIAEGHGLDAGKIVIRVVEPAVGLRALSPYGDSGAARFRWPVSAFKHHRLADAPLPAVAVKAQPFGSQLFVELPSWMLPTKPAAAAPAAAPDNLF